MSVTIDALGLRAKDRLGLAEAIHQGLSAKSVRKMLEATGLTQDELFDAAHIPISTGRRRLAQGDFEDHESERIARIARVYDASAAILGKPRDWLQEANPRLGGRRPIDVAGTDLGAIEVEALLGRLAHGVY